MVVVKNMLKLFKKYLAPYKAGVIVGPCFKVLEAIFELIVPLIVANIIDYIDSGENLTSEYIVKQGLILLALAVIGFFTTMVCQYIACRISSKYAYNVSKDLYAKVNTLSFKEIDDIGVSSLQTRLTTDVSTTQRAVAMLIRLVVRAPLIVIGGTVMSFFVSPKLGIIFVGVGLLIGLVLFLSSKFSLPYNRKIQTEIDNITNITKENLTGTRVVRAFNKQEYERNRFYKEVNDVQKTSTSLSVLSALLNPLTTVIVNVAIILIFYFSGNSSSWAFGLSKGEVSSLINYLVQISLAVVVVGDLVVTFSKASVSAKRINDVLVLEPTIVSGKEKTTNKEDIIRFDNVSYSYSDNDSYAIKDTSFDIKRGNTIGIIGGTGSGKTTIINLLNRFYDVTKGTIYYNDVNIKDISLDELRSSIAVVDQKVAIFKGTIRSNLLFGNRNASEEDMWFALDNAQARNVVESKENGLDSVVEELGKNFSGGQRQRLSIARALIKKPKILVLDDSTSALDFKTDLDLRTAIKNNYKETTLLIISQRVNAIKNADEIIVLDEGKIVGLGKHDDLIKTCQVYKEICDSQDSLGGNK